MKISIRLLVYLVLNIIISAATTLLVLSWWDSNHRVDLSGIGKDTGGNQPITINPTLTPTFEIPPLPPFNQQVFVIQNVFGAGDLSQEVVVIERAGEGDWWLTGWRLVDEQKKVYTFPRLRMNKGGTIQIFTRSGVDSIDKGLYWGSKEAIWQTGETVTLLDPLGTVRFTYRIP